MTVIAKPTKREPSKASRPMPRCACEHSHRKHRILPALGGGVGGCLYVSPEGDVCPCQKYRPAQRKGISPKCGTCAHTSREHYAPPGMRLCSLCDCTRFVMRASVWRSAPIPRKAKTKVMPKCRTCAHPFKAHPDPTPGLVTFCTHCFACTGYEPARRGSKASRRTPTAALRKVADGLWSRLVHARPGGCEIQQYHKHECSGGFQAMHGIPRTFSATRWLPIDGFKGCADAHLYFTKRPEAWSALLLEAWGLETFRELWALARSSQKPDMDVTVASLRAELARMGGR